MGNIVCCDRNEGRYSSEISVVILDKDQQLAVLEDNRDDTNFAEDHHYINKSEKQKKEDNYAALEEKLESLGKYVSVEEMKDHTSPAILEKQRDLETFKGSVDDHILLEEILVFRSPFQLNSDSTIYHGYWSPYGAREGFGTLVLEDGRLHEGLWRDGKIYKGRLFELDGTFYEGEIVDSLPHGKGKKVFPNETIYRGEWRNGHQVSMGERIFYDDYKYFGLFVDDLYYGRGKFFWPDKSEFEGEFVRSSLCGIGDYRTPDGDYFSGFWYNNLPNGNGVYVFANLNHTFEGDYKNGEKEGQGRYTFGPDHYYLGEWKIGMPHGNGDYYQNGVSHKGLWRYGRLIHIENNNEQSSDVQNIITLKIEKEKFKMRKDQLHLMDQNMNILGQGLKLSKTFKAINGLGLLSKVLTNNARD